MKVSELIDKLKELNQDKEIIISSLYDYGKTIDITENEYFYVLDRR